ncbi:LysR substrate-binding domain-containing protein [Paracidovorax wautersii]|uniref:DNA-binding transcriptional LysR family regulator n=1 Tax=Paracidovorax wautersii TaxID=1177982 RepID=A0ABU1I948_9BURK|nr:LysR substrate-binding domain-containing protein [Paracidovorax wautersii]MDR6213745.1 DNA-binding transcriptional LysR family regulator [Paracidovorax wautersii]
MKLHLLRYFAVLAEELHFGRAAERLAITQPPLSSGIKALEDELGVKLFERTSKHVSLTPAGTAYLVEVRVVLDRVDRAGDLARAVAAGLRGRLEIGFTGSMVYRDMPAIVRAFGERAPGIEVNLREMSSGEQIDALLHRQLHAGFLNADTVPDHLASLPLAPDHFVCCLPEDHAMAQQACVDLRALAGETFVMFSREVAPANHDNVIALFYRAGIHPHTRHAARQWLTVVALVSMRIGVALVPASMAQAAVKGVRFVPIAGLQHPTVGVLAWHEDAVTPALRTFLDMASVGTG